MYKKKLTHPTDYRESQLLGEAMRENNVQAIRFFSARDQDNGINIAVFKSTSFDEKSPLEFQHWHCIANLHKVEFVHRDLLKRATMEFSQQEFFN